MAIWPFINSASPAATDKVKFGDDVIRAGKAAVISALQTICNYQDNGGTVAALRTAVWSTAGRPSGSDLVDRVTGYNTDLGYEEYYDAASTSWKAKVLPKLSSWSVASRPSTPYTGQYGYNSDLAITERWNGTSWDRISGSPRGFIEMWSGSIGSLPTGWVLCDGVQRTYPDGGTYTPPNLEDKFIVGAGNTYTVAATGGEATHVLTQTEMPAHTHDLIIPGNCGGQGGMTMNDGTSSPHTYTSVSKGGGLAHNNLPPYYALCYLYKI